MMVVIHEDEKLIVINKPNGLLVHPSRIARDAEVFALQQVRDYVGQHVHPVHRLDRKTSGVLLFAKDKAVLNTYRERLAHHETIKTYLALVRGFFPESVKVDHPLVDEKGKSKAALTHFECIQHYEIPFSTGKFSTSRYALIKAFPKTGRMHQIRRHLNHLRHPIIGDRPHGCNKQNRFFLAQWGLENMCLHAASLALFNPETGEHDDFHAELPAFFTAFISRMKKANLLKINVIER